MAKWLTRYAKDGDKVKDKKSTKPPIYITHDPNDPRIQAYADSNKLYRQGEQDYAQYRNFINANHIPEKSVWSNHNGYVADQTIQPIRHSGYFFTYGNNNDPSSETIAGTNITPATSNMPRFNYNGRNDQTDVMQYQKAIQLVKYLQRDKQQLQSIPTPELHQFPTNRQEPQPEQININDLNPNEEQWLSPRTTPFRPAGFYKKNIISGGEPVPTRENGGKVSTKWLKKYTDGGKWDDPNRPADITITPARGISAGTVTANVPGQKMSQKQVDALLKYTQKRADDEAVQADIQRTQDNIMSQHMGPAPIYSTQDEQDAHEQKLHEMNRDAGRDDQGNPVGFTKWAQENNKGQRADDFIQKVFDAGTAAEGAEGLVKGVGAVGKSASKWLENYGAEKSIPSMYNPFINGAERHYSVPSHLEDVYRNIVQQHTDAGLFAPHGDINEFLTNGNFKTPEKALSAYIESPGGQRVIDASRDKSLSSDFTRNLFRNLDLTAGERVDAIPKSDYEWYNDFTLPPTNENIAAHLRDNRSIGLGAWNNRPDLRSIFENAANEQSALSNRVSDIRENIRNKIPSGPEQEEAERLSDIQHGIEHEAISARLANQIEQAPNMRFRPAPSESPAATGLEYYRNRDFQNLRSMGDLYRSEYDRILRTPATPRYQFKTPSVPDKPIEDILNEVGVSKEDADAFKTHLNKPKSAPGMLDYSGALKEDIHIRDKSILENTEDIPKQIKTYEEIKSKLNPDDRNHAKVIAQLNRNLSDLYSTNWLRNGFQDELTLEGKVPTKKNLSIHTMGSGTKYLIDEDGKVLGNISGIDPQRPRVGTAAILEEHHAVNDPNNNISDALYRGVNQGLMKSYGTNLETAQNFANTEFFNPKTGKVERMQRAKNYWESRLKPRKGLGDLPAAEKTDYGNIKMVRGLAPYIGAGVTLGALKSAMSQQDIKQYGGTINKTGGWLSKY